MQSTHLSFAPAKPTIEERRAIRAQRRAATNLRDLQRAETIGNIIGMAIVVCSVLAVVSRFHGGAL